MAMAFDIAGTLDAERFGEAFEQVVADRDVLRTTIQGGAGGPTQRVHPAGDAAPQTAVVDWSGRSSEQLAEQVGELEQGVSTDFDPSPSYWSFVERTGDIAGRSVTQDARAFWDQRLEPPLGRAPLYGRTSDRSAMLDRLKW